LQLSVGKFDTTCLNFSPTNPRRRRHGSRNAHNAQQHTRPSPKKLRIHTIFEKTTFDFWQSRWSNCSIYCTGNATEAKLSLTDLQLRRLTLSFVVATKLRPGAADERISAAGDGYFFRGEEMKCTCTTF